MNIIILILLLLIPNIANAEYLGCFEPSETVYATVQFNGVTGEVAATSVLARVLDPDDTTTPTATPTMSAVDGTNAVGLFRGSFSVGATPLAGTWTIRFKGTVDGNVQAGSDTFHVVDTAGDCASRTGVVTSTVTDKTGYSLLSTGLDAVLSSSTGAVNIATSVWSDTATIGTDSSAINKIWDEPLANHNIANTAGKKLKQLGAQAVMSGTLPAQTGIGKTQIILDAGASGSSNLYDEALIVIDSGGAAVGEGHHILYYDGPNRIAYVDDTWINQPAINDTYQIYAVSAIDGLTGKVEAGNTVSTIVFAANASASNDYYNNQTILIAAGTGQGQRRRITGYVGATKTATVSPNWVTTPSELTTGDGISTYMLYNGSPVQVDSINSNVINAASIVDGAITPAKEYVIAGTVNLTSTTLKVYTALAITGERKYNNMCLYSASNGERSRILSTGNGYFNVRGFGSAPADGTVLRIYSDGCL